MLNLVAMCLDVWKLSQMAHPFVQKRKRREKINKGERGSEGEKQVDIWYKYEQIKCGQIWAINIV